MSSWPCESFLLVLSAGKEGEGGGEGGGGGGGSNCGDGGFTGICERLTS